MNAGSAYAIVLRTTRASMNMSDLRHFERYAPNGVVAKPDHRVDVARVRIFPTEL